MSHKHARKEQRQRALDEKRASERQHAAAVHPGPSGLRPVIIGVVVGVVAIGSAAIWGALRRGDTPAAAAPAVAALPPAPPGTRVPINTIDAFTGKPITASSPTVNHKGYVLAFCCDQCTAYKSGWARMGESERDAVIRRFLK